MYNFYQILGKSKNKYSKKLLKDLYYSETSAQPFFKLVKEYFDNNPEASDSDAYEFFFQLFYNSNQELSFLPTIKSDTLRLNICNYLVNNPKELEVAYDKVHREEEKGKFIETKERASYKSNKLTSSRLAVIQGLSAIREVKNSLSEEEQKSIRAYINAPKRVQSQFKHTMDTATRRYIDDLKDYFDGTEFTQLHTFLKKQLPDFEAGLKESYIKSLTFLGVQFKRFGLLEKYCKDQNRFLDKLNMKELGYPLNAEQNTNGSITVEELFSKETLDKMSINQLSMLNSFWMNRYTKELESMNQSFFIVTALNLWSDIKNAPINSEDGRISININEQELENIYKKMYFLHETSQIMLEHFNKNLAENKDKESVVVGENGNTARVIETAEFENELDKAISEDYSEYFGKLNPKFTNDFLKDFGTYRIIDNSMHNAYRLKDMNMIAILSNLQKRNFSKNWGVVLEDGKDIETSKKVLLGIDFEGFNMPVRLHIDKSVIEEFFKANQDTTIVPVYEGETDFRNQGKVVSTQILMPLSKPQKIGLKQIEERQKIDSPTKNLVEHLRFLENSQEYPEHLKEERVVRKKGKAKIVRKPPEKRYVDLVTGKLYNKTKDGELLEIENKAKEYGGKYE